VEQVIQVRESGKITDRIAEASEIKRSV